MTIQITHKSGKTTTVECESFTCVDTDGSLSIECFPNPSGRIHLDIKGLIVIYDIKHRA